jgi:hypothetical protein
MKKRISEGQKLVILSLVAILIVELMLMSEFTGFSVFKVFEEDEAIVITPETLEKSAQWINFESKYGGEWDVEINEKLQSVKKIKGYHFPLGEKITKGNADSLATRFIVENKYLLNIEKSNLKLADNSEIQIKANNKRINQVVYTQRYKDIPVYGSRVIFTAINDEIISFTSDYYSNIDVPIIPLLSVEEATKIALREIDKRRKYSEVSVKDYSLIIFPVESEDDLKYRLAYKIEFPNFIEEMSMWVVYIDAHNGKILLKENRLITDSVSGRVMGSIYPEDPRLLRTIVPFKNEFVNVESFSNVTDEGGYYEIVGLSGNIILNSQLEGPWTKIYNEQQDESVHSLSLDLPITHDWNWANFDDSYKKEESNAFYHVNIIHDFMENLDVYEMNYQIPTYVNSPQDCNAYYCPVDEKNCVGGRTGPFIVFFQSLRCESTALSSDIIYHEYTHGVTDQLIGKKIDFPYSGEPGNLNEGWSDYFACSINNNSCLSEGIFQSECLRNCENSKRYPQDYAPEPHYGAEIVSGAGWDLREKVGQEMSDSLIINAMRLMPTTFSEFLENVLVIDDDNGDLSDGTPNIEHICNSFLNNHGIYSTYCRNYSTVPIALINYPLPFFEAGVNQDRIQINGTVFAPPNSSLDNYIIEYNQDNSWKSDGVFLDNDGRIEVDSGSLGYINVSYLKTGSIGIRVIARDISGSETISNEIHGFVYREVILSPNFGDFKRGNVEIVGSVSPFGLINYSIVYGKFIPGETIEQFLTDGISLIGNGQYSIINGTLGYWDTSKLEEGIYLLKIISNRENIINSSSTEIFIIIDNNIKEGWPIEITPIDDYASFAIPSQISVGDIEGDGIKEVVFSNDLGDVYIYDNMGKLKRKLQFIMEPNETIFLFGMTPPSLSDLDGDGSLEIIAGSPILINNENLYNKIMVWKFDGSPYSELWPKKINLTLSPYTLVYDLDNDGTDEIISGDFYKTYIWKPNGEIFNTNWPLNVQLFERPSIVDMNNDGIKEVILVTNNSIYFVDINGTIIGSVPTGRGYPVSVGDVDNDGSTEMIVKKASFTSATGYELSILDQQGNLKYGPIEGYFITENYNSLGGSNAVLGDLNNDKMLEIAYLYNYSYNPENLTTYYNIFVLNHNGSIRDGWPIEIGIAGGDIYSPSSAVIADITGDNNAEIIFSIDTFTYALDLNGEIIQGFPKPTPEEIYFFSISDIDNNGRIDIIGSSASSQSIKVYAWEFDTYNSNKLEWPQFHHDAQHTGLYTKQYLCADITNDGRVSAPDIIAIVNYVFKGGSINVPAWVADVNGNGEVTAADILYLVKYIYKAGPAPTCNSSNFVTTQTTYTQAELQYYEQQLAEAGITVDITPETTTTKTAPKVGSFD